MNIVILIFSFILAFSLTIYGTPRIQKVALRYNMLDTPDGKLKTHTNPVPYMGGVIIYFSFISPIGLLFPFNREILGILFAGSTLLIIGLFDDLKALNPGIKFIFQIVAAYILLKSGIHIKLLFLPLWLNYTLSFIWILSIINAINIIDIMDGLASSIGLITSITIFLISLYTNDFIISILSLSLAASLLAFLKFNWMPAKIYLGDAGSMFIGLILCALTIMGDYSKTNDFAFFSGFFILAIPIFDTLYVIILRLLRGKSPFWGSPDHFALRLKVKYNLTSAQTVGCIIIIQFCLSALVIINFYTTPAITIGSIIIIFLFFSLLGIDLAKVQMD